MLEFIDLSARNSCSKILILLINSFWMHFSIIYLVANCDSQLILHIMIIVEVKVLKTNYSDVCRYEQQAGLILTTELPPISSACLLNIRDFPKGNMLELMTQFSEAYSILS